MPQSNVFFFTGENEYLLTEELSRWKEEFRKKHGEENLLSLQAKQQTALTLMDVIAVMPFLAEKRLVVCDGVPSMDKDDMKNVLASCHPQTVLVFVAPKPDKRLSAVKFLLKEATVKESKPFTPKELREWIERESRALGIAFGPGALDMLLDCTGNDPRMLSQELRKLSLYADGAVTTEHVRLLSPPSGERVLWGLTNLLGQRKIHEALRFFREQIERGEDPYSLWSILLDMTRKTLSVWAARKGGIGPNAIASELSMHPMAVRGVLPLAESLDEDAIARLTELAAESDKALKTGGYKYTVESPEEVIALTERLVLACGA